MTAGVLEQRNPYKGTPPRAWLRLRLLAADGSTQDLDLLSDTGSPYGLIVSTTIMNGFKEKDASDVNSNYGPLTGGWLQVAVPAIGFDRLVIGYASDGLVAATQLSNPDFGGLIGLPLLQMMQYGGDAKDFWVRPAAAVP